MNIEYNFELKQRFKDHFPVLIKETADIFNKYYTDNQSIFLDCTLGAAGHTRTLFELFGKQTFFIAVERDWRMIEIAKKNLYESQIPFEVLNHNFFENEKVILSKLQNLTKGKVYIIYKRFSDIAEIIKQSNLKIDYLLCDLGISLAHFQNDWGFSYSNQILDMKLDPRSKDILEFLNDSPVKKIADVLFYFGEEKFAKLIAKEIVKNRPIQNVMDLKNSILSVYRKKIKKYTSEKVVQKSFQALRIYSNDELKELEIILNSLPYILKKIAIFISFHSLEDRMVKHKFKELSRNGFSIITRKPITPNSDELKINLSSHSAKMRVILCERKSSNCQKYL